MKSVKLFLITLSLVLSGCKTHSYEAVFKDLSDEEKFEMGVMAAHYKSIDEALKAGVDVDKELDSELTALGIAAHNGNSKLVKYLLRKGADPNHSTSRNGKVKLTPLKAAVINDQVETTKLLIENGARIGGDPETSVLPLAIAAGNIALAELLIESGADVSVSWPRGSRGSLLTSAIIDNNIEMTALLLKSGADANKAI